VGIVTAFPIQTLALPIVLAGQDIIGQARTGTGKTLAFGIPILQQLSQFPASRPSAPSALVVVPTRELASQVADDLRTAGSGQGARVLTVYGGRAYEPQIEALRATVRTTSMVMLIIIFASMFSHVIALIGAPTALFNAVVAMHLPRWAFFAMIFLVLLVIAYALEELSVMIIILPILFPLVTGLGFDPIWFGIIMVVWLEIGLITPPVGLNLFVIQGLMPGTTARDVAFGTTPYVILMIVLVVLLFVFPDIALWLPRHMTGVRS